MMTELKQAYVVLKFDFGGYEQVKAATLTLSEAVKQAKKDLGIFSMSEEADKLMNSLNDIESFLVELHHTEGAYAFLSWGDADIDLNNLRTGDDDIFIRVNGEIKYTSTQDSRLKKEQTRAFEAFCETAKECQDEEDIDDYLSQ